MKTIIFIIISTLAFSPALAGEVKIFPGQSLTVGNTTVTCTNPGAAARPLELRACQHWDKFNRACLYEKKTLVWKDLKCDNSCQIWDDFNGVCLYESSCRFIPGQEAFVLSSCADFDRFNKVCRRTNDALIR